MDFSIEMRKICIENQNFNTQKKDLDNSTHPVEVQFFATINNHSFVIPAQAGIFLLHAKLQILKLNFFHYIKG